MQERDTMIRSGRRWGMNGKAVAAAFAALLMLGLLAAPASVLAADNTLRIVPASTTGIHIGDHFVVKVVQNATVATSGAQATVNFDKTKLQIQSVALGAPYTGAIFVGADAGNITAANTSGSLKTVAASFFPPTSVPTGDRDFLVITFTAIANGTSPLGLPAGPADGQLLDGRPAPLYGNALPTVTTGGSVTVGTTGPVGATYVPLAPVRLLDTRATPVNGLFGTFAANTARSVQIGGRGGIPANAKAITGNLTVVGQTGPGYLSVTPEPNNDPKTSVLNFPLRDFRANNCTSPLASNGKLTIVYRSTAGQKAHVPPAVTGYSPADTSGATHNTATPARLLDPRPGGTGLS